MLLFHLSHYIFRYRSLDKVWLLYTAIYIVLRIVFYVAAFVVVICRDFARMCLFMSRESTRSAALVRTFVTPERLLHRMILDVHVQVWHARGPVIATTTPVQILVGLHFWNGLLFGSSIESGRLWTGCFRFRTAHLSYVRFYMFLYLKKIVCTYMYSKYSRF